MQIYIDERGVQRLTSGTISIDSDTGSPCLEVLWDSHVDGPIPEEAKVGGYHREGNRLVFSQAAFDANLAAQVPPNDVLRREAILDIWPIHRQLEAITEKEMGRPEQFDALKEFILSVKAQYP
jgi:hypothetical protein